MKFSVRELATVCLFSLVAFNTGTSVAAKGPPRLKLESLPVVDPSLVKMRAVTRGPKAHWFGYYHKHQIDASGRYLLAMEVDFEHRSPRPDDVVKIGMVDLADGDRWIELTESRAWSWQQGCMLQWRPGSETEILFNDREGDRFVCRVFDVKTRKLLRTLPMAIETVTPDGKWASCSDYRRIQYIRSGYGYAGLPDPNLKVMAPDDVGAWVMNLDTGETKLVVSVAQLANIPYPEATPKAKHYVSHFQWSPDGKRFLMFNRWVGGKRGNATRVFTVNADGSDLRLLAARGASHWKWRDPEHVLFWGLGAYRLYKDDDSGKPKETLWIAPNGHLSYIPGTNNQWLVTDTYPRGRKREQFLYLFHLPTGRAVVLGRFHSPREYRGEWRCDLHPRVSRDGKYVIIDSPHGGNGRQQYVFDISRIIAGETPPPKKTVTPPKTTETATTFSQCAAESTAPRNAKEVRARIDELRRKYAPYLRSLPAPLSARSRTLLGPSWRMKFEIARAKDGNRPEPPDWYREDLDDSKWEKTTVPEWRYTAEGYRYPPSCILWYRTSFPGPKKGTDVKEKGSGDSVSRPRTFLVFGGVDWDAEVWLNGKRLGGHVGYYEPFRFDVTGLLKDKNTLAVRIVNGPRFGEPRSYNAIFAMPPAKQQRYERDRANSIQGYRNNDLLVGSGYGIHREVCLETTGDTCLGEVLVRANLDKRQATVTLRTDATAARRLAFNVEILPENFSGCLYRTSAARDVPRGEGTQTFIIPMPDAKLWTPETPCLYRCRVMCRADEPSPGAKASSAAARLVDAQDVLFGYRLFELVSKQHPKNGLPEGMFLLNGRPLFIRGTNIQGFNALWYWNEMDRLTDVVFMLKAADFNTVRACQHVCYPEIRELFDRLGMLSEQDQGSGRRPLNVKSLTPTGATLARTCYNNPGVILLSFGNETRFDPTKILESTLAVDPERIVVPISGNVPRRGGPIYPIPEDFWANVVHDFHSYSAWYSRRGAIWTLSRIRKPGRLVLAGEYGAEALDSHDTMTQNYPFHWRAIPSPEVDTLWAHVQVEKADVRQFVGFRGKRPVNLGQYIEASQNYQADILAEVTKGLRLSPSRISGYFQFHFFDVLSANWPKSIVSHDLTPKKGYYAMAQVNQPLVPLFQLVDRGSAMELWVANDLPEPRPGCRIQWNVRSKGKTLLTGEKTIDVPAVSAAAAGKVDLSAISGVDVVTIRLKLTNADGKTLATYEQEVFLRAWREQDRLLEAAKAS